MTKKKYPSKRPSSKRRNSRKKSSSAGRFTKILIVVLGAAIVSILMMVAGWIGYEAGSQKSATACKREIAQYRGDIERLRKRLHRIPAAGEVPKVEKERGTAPKEAKTEDLSEIKDFAESGGVEKEIFKPLPKKSLSKVPKLAIIIDDVAFASQVRAIRKLPWHITPSLFPPTRRHPDTPKIAASLNHYMIHLPMEAMHYNQPEDHTLTTNYTKSEIDNRIRKIRHWFPGARFINNHTGSRFTSDMAAMKRFYPIAKRYGFVFIDSRTTPETAVPRVCKIYHDPYIARDIFLDNKPQKSYIQNQLRKAVRIAKSHGYSIAIGHPHTSTLKALADSKKILENVDVVYMDELYRIIR